MVRKTELKSTSISF